jgi:hypothetical protein
LEKREDEHNVILSINDYIYYLYGNIEAVYPKAELEKFAYAPIALYYLHR